MYIHRDGSQLLFAILVPLESMKSGTKLATGFVKAVLCTKAGLCRLNVGPYTPLFKELRNLRKLFGRVSTGLEAKLEAQ